MPTLAQVNEWMDGYWRAWESNDADDIGGLFTAEAPYYTEPYSAPWRGRQAIVDGWIGRKDEPGDAEFSWQPLTITDDVAIVQGQTVYRDPPRTYSNLWVIRLDSTGRCTEFTEWWMQHPER
jgi:hypothetical protein